MHIYRWILWPCNQSLTCGLIKDSLELVRSLATLFWKQPLYIHTFRIQMAKECADQIFIPRELEIRIQVTNCFPLTKRWHTLHGVGNSITPGHGDSTWRNRRLPTGENAATQPFGPQLRLSLLVVLVIVLSIWHKLESLMEQGSQWMGCFPQIGL